MRAGNLDVAMKTSRLILVFFLALAVGALLQFNWRRAPNPERRDMEVPSQNPPNTKPGALSAVVSQEIATNTAHAPSLVTNRSTDPLEEWRQPINFYGKVVDENGAPVGGAKARFQWTDLSEKGTSEADVTSGTDGRFALQNRQGKRLTVAVMKAGYYSSKHNPIAFEYANPYEGLFKPDANNPVCFLLRKYGKAEPLVVVSKTYPIAKDGVPFEVELNEGKQVGAGKGDIRVECWTNDNNIDAQHHHDWHCRISVLNGGLVEAPDEFAFTAPEQGYRPFDEITMLSSQQDWSYAPQKRYFVKLPSGLYAFIQFKMMAAGDHVFKLESFLNPSGSRNLEYNKDAQPKPKVLE